MDLRKGSEGGDKGLDAVSLRLDLPAEGPSPPEKKKTKKPMQRMPARMMVMGLDRRKERAMVGGQGKDGAPRSPKVEERLRMGHQKEIGGGGRGWRG